MDRMMCNSAYSSGEPFPVIYTRWCQS